MPQVQVGPRPPAELQRVCRMRSEQAGLLPGINFEAGSQDASAISATAQRCQQNEGPLLEMLRGAHSQAEKDAVLRDLGQLPPEAVQGLRDSGLKILLFDRGARQVDPQQAGVPAPLDLNQMAQDPAARAYVAKLAGRQQEEQRRAQLVQKEGGAELAPIQKRIFELQTGGGSDQSVQAEYAKAQKVVDRVYQQHNLKPLEPLPPPPQGYEMRSVPPVFDKTSELNQFPINGSPEEQRQYTQAINKLNAGLDLKDNFAQALVPQGEYYRGLRTPEAAQRLRDLDQAVGDVADHKADASFLPEQNAIVFPRDLLPDPNPRSGHHRSLVHEVGHAVDFSLAKEDPQQRQVVRDKVFAAPHATPYADTNPAEAYAEAFEARMTRDRNDEWEFPQFRNQNQDWLHKNAPTVESQIDQDLQQMARLRQMSLGSR